MESRKNQPAGKIVWIAWSLAMLMLLLWTIDSIFEFNVLSFEVFISIVLFFIVVLILIILGWVLVIRNRNAENHQKLTDAFSKFMFLIEQNPRKE